MKLRIIFSAKKSRAEEECHSIQLIQVAVRVSHYSILIAHLGVKWICLQTIKRLDRLDFISTYGQL